MHVNVERTLSKRSVRPPVLFGRFSVIDAALSYNAISTAQQCFIVRRFFAVGSERGGFSDRA